MAEELNERQRARNRGIAEDNERRDPRTLEFKCRWAAKWLGRPEDEWEELEGLIFAIEEGRLYAFDTYQKTPEEIEAQRNFMMNR